MHLPFALPQKRLQQRVELTDVAPTILKALGLEIPRVVQGHSLLDLILRGQNNYPDTAYTETYYPRIHFGWSELMAFFDGSMKYIRAPHEELYDLALDPGETNNLARSRQAEIKRLRAKLNRLLAANPGDVLTAKSPRLGTQTREKLAALGYILSLIHI